MTTEKRDLKSADDIFKMMSRPEWRKKAIEIFAFIDIRIIRVIVARGQDEWLVTARRGFSGQGFRQEDLIEMFFQMRQRVAQNPGTPVGEVAIDEMVDNARATGDVNDYSRPRITTTTQEKGERKVVLTDG